MCHLVRIVKKMIERVCAQCEKEHGKTEVPPGTQKSHGMCRRHAIESYRQLGKEDPGAAEFVQQLVAKLSSRPDSDFSPDLSKS
jgi:hypothetical protein